MSDLRKGAPEPEQSRPDGSHWTHILVGPLLAAIFGGGLFLISNAHQKSAHAFQDAVAADKANYEQVRQASRFRTVFAEQAAMDGVLVKVILQQDTTSGLCTKVTAYNGSLSEVVVPNDICAAVHQDPHR